MTDKLHLLVCDHFACEFSAVAKRLAADDVEISTLGSHCRKLLTIDDVQSAVNRPVFADDDVHVIGGNCMAGLKATDSLQLHVAQQCFYLVAGRALVDHYLEQSAYLLTPSWLEDWPAHIQQWGFDRKTARAFFAESASRFVLIDTMVCHSGTEQLSAFAEYAGLPFERTVVGLDYCHFFLSHIVDEWRLQKERERANSLALQMRKDRAKEAMTMELVSDIASSFAEEVVAHKILELYAALFAPEQVFFLVLNRGIAGKLYSLHPNSEDEAQVRARLSDFTDEYQLDERAGDLKVSIEHAGQRRGTIEVRGMAFPQYGHRYQVLARNTTKVCALALSNVLHMQQLKDAQRKLVASERMHMAAELSAGLCHNLNNMLSAVLLPAQMLKKTLSDQTQREEVDYILANTQRAVELLSKLRTAVAGEVIGHAQDVDLNRIAEFALNASQAIWQNPSRTGDTAIRMQVALQDVPPVKAVESILQGAIVNLIINAVEAMPEGGDLSVRTYTENSSVVLSVCDTGIGMDEKVSERIFEPFFTTKMNVGSGLGLSTMRAALSQWGGRVEVESELGNGTIFRMYLPRQTDAEKGLSDIADTHKESAVAIAIH